MEHPNIVEFVVYGTYALFSDPITRIGGEKTTYQIPTYEAFKGIISSVYWKPTIIWYIDKVRVMKQIQTQTKGIRLMNMSGKNDLAHYTYLKDCAYQVQAHFEWNENRPDLKEDRNENKHHNIAKRMIIKGGRRDIFLGTRECQGYVEPCVFGEGKGYYDNLEELSFGPMYHGITYADEAYSPETEGKMTVRYWFPKMNKGVIVFPRPDEIPIEMQRTIHNMRIKPFNKNNFTGLDEFKEAH